MTQGDKELLLKDLCGRLPYNVVCNRLGRAYQLVDIDIKRGLVYLLRDEAYIPYSISRGDIVKPYLRPMSSMTDEERAERVELLWKLEGHINEDVTYIYQDWLNKHHLDYRGLIKKGLAIAVTKENNPYEEY